MAEEQNAGNLIGQKVWVLVGHGFDGKTRVLPWMPSANENTTIRKAAMKAKADYLEYGIQEKLLELTWYVHNGGGELISASLYDASWNARLITIEKGDTPYD